MNQKRSFAWEWSRFVKQAVIPGWRFWMKSKEKKTCHRFCVLCIVLLFSLQLFFHGNVWGCVKKDCALGWYRIYSGSFEWNEFQFCRKSVEKLTLRALPCLHDIPVVFFSMTELRQTRKTQNENYSLHYNQRCKLTVYIITNAVNFSIFS